MPEQFHRPVRRPTAAFDNLVAQADPAEQARVAHATASALLERARTDITGESAERMIAFAAERGIDDIAELWANAPARSLPGALWRLYLLQVSIRDDAGMTALLYERGRVELRSADAVIAGAPAPASPRSSRRWSTRFCVACSVVTSPSRWSAPRRTAGCRRRGRCIWPVTTRTPSPAVPASSPGGHCG